MSKDRFSARASSYAAFRPTYPSALYDFLYRHVSSFDKCWDCGCGNGQAARMLAEKFAQVEATDISAKQIEHAAKLPNIRYHICGAEQTPFADNTFDLITVGQALHWFNIPLFFPEAERVAKPNALLATWGYSLLQITPSIDVLIKDFYTRVVGPYWDKERAMVDDHYQSIPFPFERIAAPEFHFSFDWTLPELVGYFSTWSSVQNYIIAHGSNPVEPLQEELQLLWPSEKVTVQFPLFMQCGRIRK